MFAYVAVAALAGIVAGLIFSQIILREVASIKAHISSEVALLRADLKKTAVAAVQKL